MTNNNDHSLLPSEQSQAPHGLTSDVGTDAPCYELTTEIAKKLRDASPPLSAADWRLWTYLSTLESQKLPKRAEILRDCQLSNATFYRSITALSGHGLLPKWIAPLTTYKNVEQQVRDRLHQTLGGLIEVITALGRIDLLTDTEIIEVKHIKDWKGALGQVIAYGSLYPTHQKRLHLFGAHIHRTKSLSALRETCLSLNVAVTVEEVSNG